jgi:hypothetical protein
VARGLPTTPKRGHSVHIDDDQRQLQITFGEMRAILDVFPSWKWTPDDAGAVLTVLSRRFFLHQSQVNILDLSDIVEPLEAAGDLVDELEAG